MNNLYKIGAFFWNFLFVVAVAYGQVKSKAYVHDKGADGFPVGFRVGLQWYRWMKIRDTDKSLHVFTYHMDTAEVYSNGNTQRFVYQCYTNENQTAIYLGLLIKGMWTLMSAEMMTYDSVGNKLTELTRIWNNNRWENDSQTKWTYTVNHDMVSRVSKQWTNNTWQNVDSSHFTYDINDNEQVLYQFCLGCDALSVCQNNKDCC